MLKLFITPKAEQDLEEIYEYTFLTWGSAQAEKYQDELFDCMTTISQSHQLGSVYHHIEGNYRKFNVNRHLIFYKVEREQCIITRVLHESIDLKHNLL